MNKEFELKSKLNDNRDQKINDIIIANFKKRLREQVDYLKTLPNPPQRSKEWFLLRINKITASMLAPLLKIGRYGSRRDVIGEKAGCLESSFSGNMYTHWGTDFEEEATKLYEKLFNTKITEFSLIEHPKYSFLGASPDGIADDGTMLEIKCPPKRAITGIVPDYYDCQMQLQMEVCDLEVCDFLECLFVKYASEKEFLLDDNFSVEINGFGNNDKYFERVHCNGANDEFVDPKTGHSIFKGTRVKSQYEIDQDMCQGVDEEDIHKTVYWKLERVSCVHVARDREWFNLVLPELEKAWGEIEKYREHPEQFPIDYPVKAKRVINSAVFNMETGESESTEKISQRESYTFANLL